VIASGTTHAERQALPFASRALEALAAHQHLTAAGVFALLVLAYLWPVLLGGQILTPTANLYSAAPWLAGASPQALAAFNPELGDVVGTYYPWAVLARRLIHSGIFPAWNPYALAGTPLFANSQLAWLSPFSLPLWILPLNYGLGLAAALKLWMAGFGTYLLVRELRLGFWPAMLAGVGFALCAFNVVWLTYGVFVSVAAMLPWALWLTERIVRRGRAVDALALTVVVAVVQAGGHPGTQLHVLVAVGLYALMRVLATRDGERLRAFGLVGGAIALGTMIMAVVLLPAQQAAIDTFGAAVRRNGAPGLLGSHVPPGSLRTALFPEWWGRPSEHLDGGGSNFRERTFYAGSLSLILAAIAVVSPGRWRLKAPFAVLGAIGILIPLKAPLIYPAVMHLPLFNAVQNQRMVLLFLLAVAVLAAFGLSAALDGLRSRRWPSVIAAAVVVGLIAAVVAGRGATAGGVATQMLRRPDAEVEPLSPGTVALASVAWWLVFALAAGAVLALARLRSRWRTPAAALLVLLLAFDLLHFAHGYNPTGPASQVIPRPTGAIKYLQSHAGDRRIAGVGITLEADWPTVYGLADVRGRDAPQPSLHFARLWLALDQLEVATIRRFENNTVNVLGLLGARLLLTEPEVDLTRRGVRVAYSGPDAAVFTNRRAVPRAFVPVTVQVAGDESHELSTLFGDDFDPRRSAFVRRDELGDADPPRGGAGSVSVVHETNRSVLMRAALTRPGVVVLDEQLTPGWSVRVDGRPAAALHVDSVLRGVRVAAGTHDVEWSYRVPGLRLGAILSIAGLAILLGWAVTIRARRGGSRDAWVE
jgi:hypothetical protein